MIPLLDIFEHIRIRKKIKKSALKESLDITPKVFIDMYKTKTIPPDLIFGFVSFLEIDTPNLDAIFQYNEREALYRSLPGVIAGRLVSDTLRERVTNILFFNIQIEVNPVSYISQIEPLPREIDETIHDIRWKEEHGN